jgi:monoamine oxidase
MAADSNEDVLDVAIVGAGVSGVYTGWRLLTDAPPGRPVPRVKVFEEGRRIGGRLLSVEPPGIPGVFCELGGMRYMSTQPLVRSLVENRLKLPTWPFVVGMPENLNYMRGQQFRNSDLANHVNVPFDLGWSERGVAVDLLVSTVLDELIPGVTKMQGPDLREFLATYEVDGRSLFDWGFWNLLARGMSHEAYELARVTGGYDTPMLNWNAYDTISLNFDLTPGVKFSALVDGYQAVPSTLAKLFQEAGGRLELGHRLEAFDTGPGGSVVLQVRDGRRVRPVTAKSLVLAMPRRSLELIDPTGPVLHPDVPDVRKMIESVTPIPLFKIFVAYDFPWWESLGVTKGRTVTDLPIRQCYYWATAKAAGADPDNRKGVLLASYDDGQNTAFWGGLTDPDHHPEFEPRQDRLTEQHPGSEKWSEYTPTAAMVEEVDRQLREIHDVRFAPKPYAAAYMDWGVDPYGGGVNFWNIHARSTEVIPRMTQPVPEVPVYVCGEAYSNGQGWVEGALETAELVLQNHFHLAPPDWLT